MNTLRDRFNQKWIPEPNSGCWLWEGSINSDGYGHIGAGDPARPAFVAKAHRVSYELHCGPIPAKTLVCHRCDNPSCVNPHHLFLGSHQDNMQDRAAKKRSILCGKVGEQNNGAKISADIVNQIRQSNLSSPKASRVFAISESNVRRIRTFKSWRHI